MAYSRMGTIPWEGSENSSENAERRRRYGDYTGILSSKTRML